MKSVTPASLTPALLTSIAHHAVPRGRQELLTDLAADRAEHPAQVESFEQMRVIVPAPLT
jgi:hypothetical protein